MIFSNNSNKFPNQDDILKLNYRLLNFERMSLRNFALIIRPFEINRKLIAL